MERETLMSAKSAGSFVGMPIYSLDDGRKIASVKDIIFDGKQNKITAFSIEEPGFFTPRLYFLPFEHVKSVGRDAIMVENNQGFIAARDAPDYVEFVRRNQSLTGKRLMTQSGNSLGYIADVLVDENTGKAVSYEVTRGITMDIGSGRNYVTAPDVSLVGKDAIIVPDETEMMMREQKPGGIAGAYESAKTAGGEYAGKISAYTQEQEIAMTNGKVAGRDVYDNQDNLIVSKGELITDFGIDHAVRTGKMHELALAAGVGQAQAGYQRSREGAQDMGTYWDDLKRRSSQGWNRFTESSKASADRAARKSVEAAQKRFLEGKLSDTDITDVNGNNILAKGDIITPLVLDTLGRMGRLEQVKVRPTEPRQEAAAVHLVVESPETYAQNKTKAHI